MKGYQRILQDLGVDGLRENLEIECTDNYFTEDSSFSLEKLDYKKKLRLHAEDVKSYNQDMLIELPKIGDIDKNTKNKVMENAKSIIKKDCSSPNLSCIYAWDAAWDEDFDKSSIFDKFTVEFKGQVFHAFPELFEDGTNINEKFNDIHKTSYNEMTNMIHEDCITLDAMIPSLMWIMWI